MGMGEATVIVVQGKDSAALEPLLRGVRVRSARSTAEVLAQLETFIPDAVVVSVDDEDSPLLGELASRLPAAVRLVAIGDLRSFPHLTARQPDCVVCAPPDEAAMRGALRSGPAVDVERLLHALVSTSLFGVELPTTLQQLARRLASAFDADDCMVMLPQEGSCYTAREVSEQVMTELLPLCETICQFGATVIAPPRTEHPYRARSSGCRSRSATHRHSRWCCCAARHRCRSATTRSIACAGWRAGCRQTCRGAWCTNGC